MMGGMEFAFLAMTLAVYVGKSVLTVVTGAVAIKFGQRLLVWLKKDK